MNICLFKETEINSPLSLKDERGQHIIKILHKNTGDTFTAGIIGGSAGTATITEIDKESETLTFTFAPETDGKPLNNLSMIIGFPRPIQLKRLLRDIAALGVTEVHLTGTELGEKSYMKSNLVERGSAYQMLLDGTVQAGSTHVPELFLHQTLKECLDSIEERHPESVKMALDNIRPADSLTHYMTENSSAASYVAAIGSERGWTDRERALLEEKKYTRLGMGSRIMRTETAATVAGSIILSSSGQLE